MIPWQNSKCFTVFNWIFHKGMMRLSSRETKLRAKFPISPNFVQNEECGLSRNLSFCAEMHALPFNCYKRPVIFTASKGTNLLSIPSWNICCRSRYVCEWHFSQAWCSLFWFLLTKPLACHLFSQHFSKGEKHHYVSNSFSPLWYSREETGEKPTGRNEITQDWNENLCSALLHLFCYFPFFQHSLLLLVWALFIVL